MDWLKFIGNLVPFLAPYPSWVKIAFSVAVLAVAVGIVGLIVAAPPPGGANATGSEAYLIIRGVSLTGNPHATIKVKAIVNRDEANRKEYWYPAVETGVNFVTVGPQMGPETFTLSGQQLYTISFEIHVSDGGILTSTENQPVAVDGSLRSYIVRQVVDGIKSDVVGGVVSYQLAKTRL
jgi:hypothetical protein